MDNKSMMYTADYVVFSGTLLISVVVGIFFAWKDRGKKSTKHYYFGGRKMSPVPVAASISVSFVSAIAVLGQPVEVYLYGTVFAWYILTQVLATVIAATYFVPLYHRLQLNSLYEYLGLRFSQRVRKFVSCLNLVNLSLYVGTVVYMPSLALSAVTPLKLEWAIALTSIVCTFYTTIGGMKAVIYTDFIQALVMFSGMLAVFIQGVLSVGGFDKVVAATERGGRNNFLQFDLDPRIRSSAWTIFFGIGVISFAETCCSQVHVQRYLSCKTVNMAKTALYLALVPGILFTLLTIGNGLVLYAYFEGCDPLQNGEITKVDQVMPLMVVEIFKQMPGLSGLFVSTAYCGAFSTISSGINAMSSVILTDFILPCVPILTPTRQVAISKALTFLLGLLSMILAYLISLSFSNVIQIVYALAGFTIGPLVGVVIMGVFMPWINSKGAVAGVTLGFAASSWIGVSAMFSTSLLPKTTNTLAISIDNCTQITHDFFGENITTAAPDIEVTSVSGDISGNAMVFSLTLDQTLYSLSPFLLGLVGLVVSIIVGHVVSLITGFRKPSEADPKLFMPIINNKFFRFGVPDEEEDEELIYESEKI